MSIFTEADAKRLSKLNGGLCFVHGFRGNDKTWGRFPELINNDPGLPVINVHEFIFRTGIKYKQPDIEKVSSQLLNRLNTSFERNAGIPLFLAAHSMGGVIVNTLIVNELDDAKGQQHPMASLRGCCYFASPLSGSSKAKAVQKTGSLSAKALGFFSSLISMALPKQKQLKDLSPDSRLITRVHGRFLQHVLHATEADERHLVISTCSVTAAGDWVVKEHESIAFMNGVRHRKESYAGDHRNICKPKQRDDNGSYIALRFMIHEVYLEYWETALQGEVDGSRTGFKELLDCYQLRLNQQLGDSIEAYSSATKGQQEATIQMALIYALKHAATHERRGNSPTIGIVEAALNIGCVSAGKLIKNIS